MKRGDLAKTAQIGAILVLFLFQAAFFLLIPTLGGSIFLSPDETANAVSARAFSTQGDMRIVDPVLKDGPWLRPRSFVTQYDAMVPVGFLGLPIVLGALFRVFGEAGLVLFVPLLAASVAFPLWRSLRRYGVVAQIIGVSTWLSFPTVILYANRGLYANLPVVCLAVWSAYLLWEKRSGWRSVVSGLCFGIAVAMRPTECIWMVAWVVGVWLIRNEPKKKEWPHLLFFSVSTIAPMAFAAFVAWSTYGSPFSIGYLLRDTIVRSTPAPAILGTAPSASGYWPFGFHPRAMWFNVQSYVLGMWLPWTLLAIASLIAFWKRPHAKKIVAVGVWTLFVGVGMYGQAIYQDHVGVNVVSSGNSFLRYLLPMSVMFALSIGALAGVVMEQFRSRRTVVLISCAVFVLAYGGTGYALNGTDESVLAGIAERERYAAIRSATYERFGPQTIILSDRSDKIFFPIFRVASPLPAKSDILSLVEQAPATIALFSTTLDRASISEWKSAGIDLRAVFSNNNQTMYVLTPSVQSSTP